MSAEHPTWDFCCLRGSRKSSRAFAQYPKMQRVVVVSISTREEKGSEKTQTTCLRLLATGLRDQEKHLSPQNPQALMREREETGALPPPEEKGSSAGSSAEGPSPERQRVQLVKPHWKLKPTKLQTKVIWDTALSFQKTSGHLIIVTRSGRGIALGGSKKHSEPKQSHSLPFQRKRYLWPWVESRPLSLGIPQAKAYSTQLHSCWAHKSPTDTATQRSFLSELIPCTQM